MTRFARIGRNVSLNYAGALIGGTVFVLLTPFVVRELGEVGFGIWVLIHTIVFYLNFLELGFDAALVKYVAEYSAAGRDDDVQAVVNTSLGSFVAAGVLALLASCAIALFLVPAAFEVPDDMVRVMQICLLILGIELLFSFPGSVFDGILEGRQRYDILNYTGIAFTLAGAAGTVLVLLGGFGLVGLALMELGLSLLGIVIDWLIVRRLLPRLSFHPGAWSAAAWRKIRGFSLWSSLTDLLTEGSAHLDKLLIPVVLSVSLLTPYALICSVAALIFIAVEPLSEVFFPMAAELDGRADRKALRRLLVQGTKLVLAISLPVAIAVFFFGRQIIGLWIGAEYFDVSILVLHFVVLNFLMSAFLWTSLAVLSGLGLVRRIFVFSVLELVLVVGLIVLTVPRFGLTGLAASSMAANVLIGFALFIPAACRATGLPLWRLLSSGLARPLLPAVPSAWLAHTLLDSAPPDTWLALGMDCIAVVAVYGAGFLLLSLSAGERAFYFERIRELLRRREAPAA